MDDLATNVAEQWIRQLVCGGERLQDRRVVGRDRDDADPGRLRILGGEVQLDQLIATVRSPVGRASEHQQQPLLTRQFVAGADHARLVG